MPSNEREAPHSASEEIGVLGHGLNYEEYQAEFFTLVREEYFFLDSHRRIFRAMSAVNDRGVSVDYVAVATELRKKAEMDAVGGEGYFASLTEGTIRHYSMQDHIAVLRDAWARRTIIRKLELAIHTAFEPAQSAESICSRVESDLLEVVSGSLSKQVFRLSDFIVEELNQIQVERAATGKVLGIPTGIVSLDSQTTGWRDGEFSVIGALPGRGKTSLMLQAAFHAASKGYPTLILPLEMRKEELLRRAFAISARIHYRRLRDTREMSSEDMHDTQEAAASPISRYGYATRGASTRNKSHRWRD